MFTIHLLGRSQKTRLSFTSSNSSFAKCLRKHNPLHSSSHSNVCPATRSDSSCEGQSFGSGGHQSPTYSTTFSKCTFSECSSTNGGAIYVNGGSVSFLKIYSCTFTLCSATKDAGGAIYARSLTTLDVQDSSFVLCTCEGKNDNERGGGGILIRSVTSPSVSSSSFVDNFCKRDGAGISIVYSGSTTQQIFLSSKFIKCISEGTSADGGAVHIYENNCNLGFSNCLFSLCEASSHGGALLHQIKLTEESSTICFCFFDKNKCSSASDVYLHKLYSSKTFLHSFSTSTGIPRIYPSGLDHWLPQDSIYLVNSTSEKGSYSVQKKQIQIIG